MQLIDKLITRERGKKNKKYNFQKTSMQKSKEKNKLNKNISSTNRFVVPHFSQIIFKHLLQVCLADRNPNLVRHYSHFFSSFLSSFDFNL